MWGLRSGLDNQHKLVFALVLFGCLYFWHTVACIIEQGVNRDCPLLSSKHGFSGFTSKGQCPPFRSEILPLKWFDYFDIIDVNHYILNSVLTVRRVLLKKVTYLTLTLPGPSAGVSGSLDSYCRLKPLCSGMGEVVMAHTSPTLLPPSPRTVLSLSCFKVSQCINCRDWHFKS